MSNLAGPKIEGFCLSYTANRPMVWRPYFVSKKLNNYCTYFSFRRLKLSDAMWHHVLNTWFFIALVHIATKSIRLVQVGYGWNDVRHHLNSFPSLMVLDCYQPTSPNSLSVCTLLHCPKILELPYSLEWHSNQLVISYA